MAVTTTMADLWRPCQKTRSLFYDLCLIGAGSLLIAVSAQVAVTILPVSPVPMTAQTLAVLLLAALLGPTRGVLCVAAYLSEGLAGLPVFAMGGAGLVWFAGPTGGYLLGFVPAALIVGRLAQAGWDRRFSTTIAAMALGNIVIYACGLTWLAVLITLARVDFGFGKLLTVGLAPYILGDILKVALAGMLLPSLWWVVRRHG